jgi:hypothetical protein
VSYLWALLLTQQSWLSAIMLLACSFISINRTGYDSFSVCLKKAKTGLEPITWREALLSTPLHAIIFAITQFAECTDTDCK